MRVQTKLKALKALELSAAIEDIARLDKTEEILIAINGETGEIILSTELTYKFDSHGCTIKQSIKQKKQDPVKLKAEKEIVEVKDEARQRPEKVSWPEIFDETIKTAKENSISFGMAFFKVKGYNTNNYVKGRFTTYCNRKDIDRDKLINELQLNHDNARMKNWKVPDKKPKPKPCMGCGEYHQEDADFCTECEEQR